MFKFVVRVFFLFSSAKQAFSGRTGFFPVIRLVNFVLKAPVVVVAL